MNTHPRCDHCPVEDAGRTCPSAINPALCAKVDPASASYDRRFARSIVAMARGEIVGRPRNVPVDTPGTAQDDPPESGPSLARRAYNAAGAVVQTAQRAVAGETVWAPIEVREARLAVCVDCTEYYDARFRVCNHPACGCFIPVKTRFAGQECPIGKWTAWGGAPADPGECGGCGGQ